MAAQLNQYAVTVGLDDAPELTGEGLIPERLLYSGFSLGSVVDVINEDELAP